MGSRFGGDKQLATFGANKCTLMEYNLIHAANAGFDHVIFVIRPELEETFNQQVLPRLPEQLTYDLVHQIFDCLPDNHTISEERIKPLGTAHALWCCRNLLNESFAVINADDYYGKHAFQLFLQHSKIAINHHLMVAYQLENTISEFGGVNRGLCQISPENTLVKIEECETL